MAGKATAIDLGSHTVKVIQCRLDKNGISVLRFAGIAAAGECEELASLGIPLDHTVLGLGGRDMTLRYTQVPPSPDWQLRNLMDLEIADLSGQSGGQLSADYNLLPIEDEEGGMDTILMALARNEALEESTKIVTGAGGSVAGHVPNCIALYNAYLRCVSVEDDDELVCLASIGRETTDIALLRGQDLLFARNLSSGGKVLDDAIASAFNVSGRKAESLKRDLLDLDPQSRGRYASGHAEKVTLAAGGAASMIVSAIQSSVAFCQSQTKIAELRLDKVLLCGGTARTRGVQGMLREALRCPVELFDPWQSTDLSMLPPDDAEQLSVLRSEAVIALGLALGKLDTGLYALEILPEQVKRRQRFLRRTIYNVCAALIGVVLLGLSAMTLQSERVEATSALHKLSRRKASIDNVHKEAEKTVLANAELRALAEQLSERSIPLDGVLRTLRAVHDTLPPELWITSVEVRKKSRAASVRGGTKTVIELAGRGKAVGGVDVGEVYRKFVTDFRAHPLIPKEGVTTKTSSRDGSFLFSIDFHAPEKAN